MLRSVYYIENHCCVSMLKIYLYRVGNTSPSHDVLKERIYVSNNREEMFNLTKALMFCA